MRSILLELQKESLPVDKLQKYYLKGSIYLERCEALLSTIEQEVINLDLKDFQVKS